MDVGWRQKRWWDLWHHTNINITLCLMGEKVQDILVENLHRTIWLVLELGGDGLLLKWIRITNKYKCERFTQNCAQNELKLMMRLIFFSLRSVMLLNEKNGKFMEFLNCKRVEKRIQSWKFTSRLVMDEWMEIKSMVSTMRFVMHVWLKRECQKFN